MNQQYLGSASRRGRPRSEPSRRAILDAAEQMLIERGPREISVDAIARRAGTSKATIYRWWPSKEALFLEVFRGPIEEMNVVAARQVSLRESLLAAVRTRLNYFEANPHAVRTMAGILAACQENPELAGAYSKYVATPARAMSFPIFDAAVERGEMRSGVDYDTAIDMLMGAINLRLLLNHAPADDAFAESLVDLVLRAIAGSSTKFNRAAPNT